MRLNLLKSIARSLLRTANRRLSQYRKSGIKNPDIEDILGTISERPYFNKEKGRLMTGGLTRNELEELIEVERTLKKTETTNQYDVLVNVNGGGLTGQAGAIRLGISRALLQVDAEYRGTLKPIGLLTRDSRAKERKKYGLKAARRAPQFSKR